MRRNKNLIELSRNQHHSLLLGWKIKQGVKRKVPIEEIANYIIYFARQSLFPHFAQEESQVLIYLDAKDPLYQRTVNEHTELQDLITQMSIKSLTNLSLLLNFSDKLTVHIRFEERELFPYIENVLSIQQLDEIGKLIAIYINLILETYKNEFTALVYISNLLVIIFHKPDAS